MPNVPATLDGFRRSYVLWREHMATFIALEFASGNGEEERDRTPLTVAADVQQLNPVSFGCTRELSASLTRAFMK